MRSRPSPADTSGHSCRDARQSLIIKSRNAATSLASARMEYGVLNCRSLPAYSAQQKREKNRHALGNMEFTMLNLGTRQRVRCLCYRLMNHMFPLFCYAPGNGFPFIAVPRLRWTTVTTHTSRSQNPAPYEMAIYGAHTIQEGLSHALWNCCKATCLSLNSHVVVGLPPSISHTYHLYSKYAT